VTDFNKERLPPRLSFALQKLACSALRLTALETIADNLSKADWSWGCVAAVDSRGRTIWIADAHRDGKRFVVRADEKLTAFLELERVTRESLGFLNAK
jgi:hypothetical protein